jgi:hypothetical protein
MSLLSNTDSAAQMRIRAEEALERKGTGAPRQAGELAGQFAAMLEALNGIDSGKATAAATDAATALTSSATQPRLGVGAVSLFAQGGAGEGGDAVHRPGSPQGAAANIVESAMKTANPTDVRWLTTLITQVGPET